jgi:DNA repair ATPase RecN
MPNISPKNRSNDTSHFGVTEKNLKNSVEITYASDLEPKPSSNNHEQDVDINYLTYTKKQQMQKWKDPGTGKSDCRNLQSCQYQMNEGNQIRIKTQEDFPIPTNQTRLSKENEIENENNSNIIQIISNPENMISPTISDVSTVQ